MTDPVDHVPASAVTVRYWAAARSAAGVDSDEVPVTGEVTLAWVLDRVRALHDDRRFRDVLAICSVLVGDRPVGGHDPAGVAVPPGSAVELLPPFAGG
jgi:molybdopterin converting factor small subunit